jgi:hypothetical protein
MANKCFSEIVKQEAKQSPSFFWSAKPLSIEFATGFLKLPPKDVGMDWDKI